MSMDPEEFWMQEMHRIRTNVDPCGWARSLGLSLATYGSPPSSCLERFRWMLGQSLPIPKPPIQQVPSESKSYQEALARERALVVKIHDKETELAAARMGEQNALRELERYKKVFRMTSDMITDAAKVITQEFGGM